MGMVQQKYNSLHACVVADTVSAFSLSTAQHSLLTGIDFHLCNNNNVVTFLYNIEHEKDKPLFQFTSSEDIYRNPWLPRYCLRHY